MVRKRSSLKRLISALGLALVASLILGGVAAGSASAATQYWYSCQGTAGGNYTDSACQTEGTGSYEWVAAPASSTSVKVNGPTSITLTGTVALSPFKVTCTSASGTGKIANPGEGSAGTFSTEAGSSLVLSNCTVIEGTGTGCQVEGGSINFEPLSGKATEFEGGRALQIGESGKQLAWFNIVKIEGKTCVKAKVTVTGGFYDTLNPATSTLEITAAGGSAIKINGAKGTMSGPTKVETAASEPLRLAIAKPVNTSAPTVSGGANVGTTATANPGTWTNATSFAYQWRRCSSSGTECSDISGATLSTYTVVSADEGHTLRVRVTGSNADLSTKSTSSQGGVIGPEAKHWYQCEKVGPGGSYADSACTSAGSGEYEWVKLAAGTPVSFTANALTSFKINVQIGLGTTTVECTSASGSGTIMNPTGGGWGTLSSAESLISLGGCSVTSQKGCSVEGSAVHSFGPEGTTSEESITFTGSNLLYFRASPCLETVQPSGTLGAHINSAGSALEFTSASGTSMVWGGAKVTFEGSLQLETAKGLLRFKR